MSISPDRMSRVSPVRDRSGCLTVVEALARHFDDHPDEWENPTLSSYLDAIAAWIRDARLDDLDERSWGAVADVLRVGRIYG